MFIFGRTKPKICLILTLVSVFAYIFFFSQDLIEIDSVDGGNSSAFAKPMYWYVGGRNTSVLAGGNKIETNPLDKIKRVTIAMAICDRSLQQGIMSVKSMILFSSRVILDLRIFYDDLTYPRLELELPILQRHSERFNVTLEFHLYPSTFPTSDDEPPWRQLHKTCAAQRLFYASILTEVDAVIHVDADVLFVADVRELWQFFLQMNSSQLAGMTHHDEPGGTGRYSDAPPERVIPYYAPMGVQDGVMLQNLTRLRAVNFKSHTKPIRKTYGKRIRGDQDLLNVYFHFHPEQMFLIPCTFNYIVTHCDTSLNRGECVLAKETGVAVFHGADSRFRAKYAGSLFRNLFEALWETNLEEDTVHTVANKIFRGFHNITRNTLCSSADVNILKRVKAHL